MKKIRSVIITITLMLAFNAAHTQNFPVENIQKLLDRVEGQKYLSQQGNDQNIKKQVITKNTYKFYYTGTGKLATIQMIQESIYIPWKDGFQNYMTGAPGNDKLTRCVFKFKNTLQFHIYSEGSSDNSPRTINSLEFYILTKDLKEMESLIKND